MGKVIDVHTHIGSDYQNTYSGESTLKKMDHNGIDYAVISPVPNYCASEGVKSSMEQNDYIALMRDKYPDRFLKGLGAVDPRHGQAAVKEVKRIFEELSLNGLMFSNDKSGHSMDNPIMFEFLEAIPTKENAVILMHTSFFSVLEAPFMLGKLARKFPCISFINGAGMRDTTHSNCSRDLAAALNNVYLDTACVHYIMNPIGRAVAEAGEDKLLFGSDSPYYETAYDKLIVQSADVSESVKEKIFLGNAKRLFGIGDI